MPTVEILNIKKGEKITWCTIRIDEDDENGFAQDRVACTKVTKKFSLVKGDQIEATIIETGDMLKVPQRDEDGELILDETGEKIMIETTIPWVTVKSKKVSAKPEGEKEEKKKKKKKA
jgi:hypothetical protein